MSLNIKSNEAHRLARELAQLSGVSLTRCHGGAPRKAGSRKHRRRDKPLSAELLEIGKRCAAHMKRPVKSSDHADMLYDKKGLPR